MKTYTAKTLEELLNNVAKEKGVTVEELTYFVTEEKSGFLGFGSSVSAQVYASDDVAEFIEDYLINFFSNLNMEASIQVSIQDNRYLVDLDAANNAILIGRGGQSLQGLNQVLRAATSAKFKHRFNTLIDINNYKQDRYSKVRSMAKRIAKNVMRTKIDATLDPMPNDERKVIHQELSTFKNIKTESVGEGHNRRLVIKYTREPKAS